MLLEWANAQFRPNGFVTIEIFLHEIAESSSRAAPRFEADGGAWQRRGNDGSRNVTEPKVAVGHLHQNMSIMALTFNWSFGTPWGKALSNIDIALKGRSIVPRSNRLLI